MGRLNMAFPTLWKFSGDLYLDVDGSIGKDDLTFALYTSMKCPKKIGFSDPVVKDWFSVVFAHLATARNASGHSLRYSTQGSYLYRYPGRLVVMTWGDKQVNGSNSMNVCMPDSPIRDKKAYVSLEGTLKWKPLDLEEARKIAQLGWIFTSTQGETITVINVPVGRKAEWDGLKCVCPKETPPVTGKETTKKLPGKTPKTLSGWVFG